MGSIYKKPILLQDDYFYLIKYDNLNYAILDREKIDKGQSLRQGLIGFYGDIMGAMVRLLELNSELNGNQDIDINRSKPDHMKPYTEAVLDYTRKVKNLLKHYLLHNF